MSGALRQAPRGAAWITEIHDPVTGRRMARPPAEGDILVLMGGEWRTISASELVLRGVDLSSWEGPERVEARWFLRVEIEAAESRLASEAEARRAQEAASLRERGVTVSDSASEAEIAAGWRRLAEERAAVLAAEAAEAAERTRVGAARREVERRIRALPPQARRALCPYAGNWVAGKSSATEAEMGLLGAELSRRVSGDFSGVHGDSGETWSVSHPAGDRVEKFCVFRPAVEAELSRGETAAIDAAIAAEELRLSADERQRLDAGRADADEAERQWEFRRRVAAVRVDFSTRGASPSWRRSTVCAEARVTAVSAAVGVADGLRREAWTDALRDIAAERLDALRSDLADARADLAESERWEAFCPESASVAEIEEAVGNRWFFSSERERMRVELGRRAERSRMPANSSSAECWGALDALKL